MPLIARRWLPASRSIVSGALVALTLGALVGCGEPVEAAEAPAPPPVHVETPTALTRTPETSATAELRPRRMATLRSEAAGRITLLPAERGRRVEAGAILARLDTGRTSAAVGAANAGIEQAEASLAQARREQERAAALRDTGAIAPQQADRADDAVALAEAALAQARAQLRLTRRGLTEAVLRAPFSGTVVEVTVEEGEFVAPGAPMVVLVDTSGLESRALFDVRATLDIRPGAAARAEVFAREGERFEGRVIRVSEVIDSRTRRLPIDVEVLDPDDRLRAGLMARIYVDTGAPEEVLRLPDGAVFERFSSDFVYVVEEGVARRRAITVRDREDGFVFIEPGGAVGTGDRVVIAGRDRVAADEPVQVVERSSSTERAETPPSAGTGEAAETDEADAR